MCDTKREETKERGPRRGGAPPPPVPVPGGVLHRDVGVLVDAAHSAGGGEGLEHAVGPAPVAVLQGLDDLQVQVDVDQVPDLQPPGVPVPVLLAWGGGRGGQP